MPDRRTIADRVRDGAAAFAKRRGIEELPGETSWVTRARLFRQDAVDWWEPDWRRMEENNRFYRGKIFTGEEKRRAKEKFKALIEFNDLPTIVNSATGREPINRFQPAFKPRDRGEKDPQITAVLAQFGIEDEVDDPLVAQALTEVLRWIEQGCDAPSEISDAFFDAFVGGIGNDNTSLDPLSGLNGKIMTSQVPPWMIAWDPDAKKRNMRDAAALIAFKWVAVEEAAYLFPNHIDHLISQSESSRFHINPTQPQRAVNERPTYQPGEGREFFNPDTRQVLLTDYQIKTRGDRWHFEDPETGEERFVDREEWLALKKGWNDAGLSTKKITKDDEISTLGGEILYDQRGQWVWQRAFLAGDNPLQKELEDIPIRDFTYGAITCYPYKTRRGSRWFGPVDLGREPARWKAKFMSLVVDILSAGSKGAVHAERNAFEDVDEAMKQISDPHGVVIYNEGAIESGKVKFGPQAPFPSFGAQMIEYATTGIWTSMGMNPTSAGMLQDPRRAPFQTVNAIMQAGQSVFAMPFDSLRFHRLGLAKKYAKSVLEFLPPDEVLRAVGHDHVPGILQLVKRDEQGEVTFEWDEAAFERVLRYDVVADDQPTSSTQMLGIFQILTQTDMFSLLQQSGQAPPLEVLLDMMVSAGLPKTAADKWLESAVQGPTPEEQQAIVQSLLSQLSPELQEAVMAELQAPQTAEQGAAVQ